MKTSVESRTQAEAFLAVFASEDAFRSWYDRILPSVYSFVLYRCGGNRSVAMELTQEAFVEAVRARDRFDGRSTPLTWICGIARHKLADHFRRLAREDRRNLQLVTGRVGEEAVPGDWEHAADVREDVLRSLRSLPAAQGFVLALHYLDGLSVQEIARRMDRTEKAIESLISRGRESFKRTYADGPGGERDA